MRRPNQVVRVTHQARGAALPAAFAARIRALVRRAAAATASIFADVSVAFVDSTTMRALNKRYRRQPHVTDVLSFTYQADPVAGEIIICLAQARRQAKQRGHSLVAELEVLVAHGLLHLAGYDHTKLAERKVMMALEQRVLAGRAGLIPKL